MPDADEMVEAVVYHVFHLHGFPKDMVSDCRRGGLQSVFMVINLLAVRLKLSGSIRINVTFYVACGRPVEEYPFLPGSSL